MVKIAHTADIHIRSLSRHSEYYQAFQYFVDDCRSQAVDHIFVGGDIFHTKTTGISPEYIDLLTWWLNKMSTVAPVHLILGNHDGNLVNLSRQDAVSPIVDAMGNSRVSLYKKSGTYKLQDGFNLCVFSCFDEEGWSSVRPLAGEVNIAAFHGPVRGSTTETGWDIDEGVTVDYFNDYDFCFLGDIHKPQMLGYRQGKPWIAYPGTPIQQNYSEQLEHGYLLWNIKNSSEWNVETRQLPNPKPYVTIDWQGSLEDTLVAAKKFPKSSRFRIRANVQLTQDEVHVLSETLKTSMLATEVTYKSDYQIDKQTVKAGTTSLVKKDLRSIDVMTKLLKDFYKENDFIDKNFDKTTDLMKNYLSAVSTVEDIARGSKWTLRQMQWDNLFSYGEGNVIEFDNLRGIVGIFGPNRVGKSSIVGTLMYTLFNTTDRGSMKNISVCNVRKDYCSSRAVFDHNGTSYVVERQTTKNTNKKGVVSASTALNLFKMREDGEMEDLCGEQRNDTEKTVRSLLGSADDFLMTSLSAQGESNYFMTQGSTKRRAILTRFLDLDIFDKLHELASKDVTSIKSQLKNFPDRDWEATQASNADLLKSYKESMTSLNNVIGESRSELDSLRQELSKHNASPISQADVDAQRERVESLKAKSEECAENIESLEKEVADLQEKLVAVQKIVDFIDVASLRKKLEAKRQLESSITELRHSYEKEGTRLENLNKSLKILEEVPCGDSFPTCKFIKNAHTNKQDLPEQLDKTNTAKRVLAEAKEALELLKDDSTEEKLSKYDKAVSLCSKLSLEISRKETELEKTRSLCGPRKTAADDAAKKLSHLEEALNNEENVEVITIRSKLKDLSDQIKKYDDDKMNLASQHGKLLSTIEQLDREKKSRDELLVNVKIYETIANAFSKKGIPLLVTKSQLPLINMEISKILQGIVDFTIELESDEDTDSLEIYINYGDSKRIIELCSGMEKTIAAIALRVALLNVSSLPRPDFFIVDEGFGTLDSAGVEACNRLLVSMKRYFKTVIVITHVDGIKDSADHVLEITKNEKDAKIEWT
jgi:DNA repair exonuclease SbcCD ATPase subunit/DNA repair exonuclease SbcCD nuclease subunit